MQAILKPLSDPGLDEIIVSDSLFAVGRYEPPFASIDKSVLANLSRRHARIFEEAGAVYIADLGSSNGTKVNGEAVGQRPVRLGRGDRIAFADKIEYEIEILGQAARGPRVAESPETRLTLIPEPARDGIEPIVVTSFPFLISKADVVFGRYRESFPKEVNYLSRRHAHIFLKDGRPCVEDLGSTNGTYLNGTRMDEHARPLKAGDLLAFGGSFFSYRVHTEHDEPTVGKEPGQKTEGHTAVARDATEFSKTTFVSSANSFLDIFCVQEEDPAPREGQSEGGEVQGTPGPSAGEVPRRPGFVRRARVMVGELRASLSDGEGLDRRRVWMLLGVGIVIAAMVGMAYLWGADSRKVRELIARHDYQGALATAGDHLQGHPDDGDIQILMTEATIRLVAPEWMARLEVGDFEGAGAVLRQAQDRVSVNPGGERVLDLLRWIGELEAHLAHREGPDAPLTLYRDEYQVAALTQWWDADPDGHRGTMDLILNYLPEFEPTRTTAFSHLRRLRGEKSIYIAAIDQLKATIGERLDSDQPEGLGPVFDEFERTYPKVAGIDRVREEWWRYLSLRQALRDQDIQALARLPGEQAFVIGPFVHAVARMREESLPPKEVAQRYQRAAALWKTDQYARALDLLEHLRDGPWGDPASEQLVRKTRIVQAFEALEGTTDPKQREGILVALYPSLDATEDVYFVRALHGEFETYKRAALEGARRDLEVAGQRWEAYREEGGIRGIHRLDAKVSRAFERQARRLSEAYAHADRGVRTCAALKAQCPGAWLKLERAVSAELALQRRSLKELSMVLNPPLLDAKLALIVGPDSLDETKAGR